MKQVAFSIFFWLSFSFFIKICRIFFWQVYQNWNQSVTTFFESDVETAFRLSSGTYWGTFSSKELQFHIFLVYWILLFSACRQKFWKRCQKWHPQVLRNKLKTKSTSKYLRIFDNHLSWANESWAFWPKTFNWAAKTCFSGSSRTICKKNFQKQFAFYNFFCLSVNFFGTFGTNFLTGLSKLNSRCPQDVRRPIKNFRQRCRNCVLPVQWNFLLDMCFLKKSIFTTFWTVSSSF